MTRFVQALALGVDPAWRRLPAGERRCSAHELARACGSGPCGVTTLTYSSLGLQPGADLLLWSLGPSVETLEERAAAALRTGLGAWTTVRQSLVGCLAGSPYVRRAPAEPALFTGRRSRYLVVYPFTKTTDWYLLGQETRQGIMNEHIRVARRFPQVRQLLATSFGLGDQDYVVAYETDDLTAFSDLVRALRATEGRRATARDTPLLVTMRREPDELAALLAG